MSEQYQGDNVANAGTQAMTRKKWSSLTTATAVLNTLLLAHILFASSIINFVLGVPTGGQEISLSEYNDHLSASLMSGSSFIVLSIVAIVVNVRFFGSLRPATASDDHAVFGVTRTARIQRIAAGLLIAFPSIALGIPAANLAYILFV
jgi:hypothetical protein